MLQLGNRKQLSSPLLLLELRLLLLLTGRLKRVLHSCRKRVGNVTYNNNNNSSLLCHSLFINDLLQGAYTERGATQVIHLSRTCNSASMDTAMSGSTAQHMTSTAHDRTTWRVCRGVTTARWHQ